MTRHIVTLDNGHVIVAAFAGSGAAYREFYRRGSYVCEVLSNGRRPIVSATFEYSGPALVVRRGESLADTIQRALDEQDGKQSRSVFQKWRRPLASVAVLTVFVIAGWLGSQPFGIVR